MNSIFSTDHLINKARQTDCNGATADQRVIPSGQQQVTRKNGKSPALGPLPLNGHLPFNRNPNFIGRDDELKKLHFLLNPVDNRDLTSQYVAITGVAGIGKTQLAVEYAFRFGHDYSGGVYWVNTASREHLNSAFADLAMPMGLNLPMNLPHQIVAEHVLAFLRQPVPRLLIFDEVNDAMELSPCAIASGGCRMLLTSRRASWQGATRLPLTALKKEAALALLLSRRPDLQASTDGAECQVAETICERLGYLPLALELAALYLGHDKHLSLADYLHDLEAGVSSRQTDPLDESGKKSLVGYKQAATVALQLSFRELAKTPGAKRLFFAAQQFAPEAINPNLLGKVANIDLTAPEGVEALKLLQELGLGKTFSDGRLQLHQLLAHLGQKLATRKGLATLREHFVVALLDFMKTSDDSPQLQAVALELPLVIKAAEIAISQKIWPRDFELCNHLGLHFKKRGDHVACLQWWQRAQQICEAHQPFAEELFMVILNNVGHVLQAQGDWIGAFTRFKRVLKMRTSRFGEEHPEVASSIDDLGELLKAQGNWDGALRLHERALAIRANALGDTHSEVVISLMKIGEILRSQRHYAEAFVKYQQALSILQKVYGEAHPYAVICLDNLGRLSEAQGDGAGALTYYERALAIRRKALGEEHPEVAMNLNNIGLVLHAQQDWAGAIDHLRRALNILEKHFDLEHFNTQTVRENLASIERGRLDTKAARKIDGSHSEN